ncbi:MAG: ATP-dependent helicase [Deltaproteobacteria bacterium]|nr:ATP-dependent helicase [Deltaproteobacteria bacterium]
MVRFHPTPEQMAATETLGQGVALLAAAGSGKTAVLTHRYVNILKRGVEPNQILAVTFTNEAAEELRTRISKILLAEQPTEQTCTAAEKIKATAPIGTIHSFCYRILNQFGSHLGLERVEEIISAMEGASEFEQAYERWLHQVDKQTLEALLCQYTHLDLRELAKAFWVKPNLLKSKGQMPGLLLEAFQPILDGYKKRFTEKGIYSFDELESFALEILKTSSKAKRFLQEQFDYVLVDEFQDTSRQQWEILGHICEDRFEKLFLVGDPRQSIYRFRNADVKLFWIVTSSLQNHNGIQLELNQNFRSSTEVLKVINEAGKSLFSESSIPFLPLRGSESAGKGAVEIVAFPCGDKGRSKWHEQEVSAVLSTVTLLIKQGTSPGEIALLFRASDKMESYLRALSQAGFPVSCKRTSLLGELYDFNDIHSYLKAVENPLDDFAVACFLRSRFIKIDCDQLAALKQGKQSLFESLLQMETPDLKWFCSLIEKAEMNTSFILKELFSRTHYWPTERNALLQLLSSIENLPLSQAIRKMESCKQAVPVQSSLNNPQSIQLMTVHGAKGLEFPHVLIVDTARSLPKRSPLIAVDEGGNLLLRKREQGEWVADEQFEYWIEQQRKEDCEESKRILYVAITRAQISLTLFVPDPLASVPKDSWAALIGKAFLCEPKSAGCNL